MIVATLLLFENINRHITLTSILAALCLVISLSFYRAAMFKHLSFSLHTSGNLRTMQESSEQSSEILHSDAGGVRGIPKSGTTCTSDKLRTAKEACHAIANGLTQPSRCIIQQIFMCTEAVSTKGHVFRSRFPPISSVILLQDDCRSGSAQRGQQFSYHSMTPSPGSAHGWNAKDYRIGEKLTSTC